MTLALHPPSPTAGPVSDVTVRTLRMYQFHKQVLTQPQPTTHCTYSLTGFTTSVTPDFEGEKLPKIFRLICAR